MKKYKKLPPNFFVIPFNDYYSVEKDELTGNEIRKIENGKVYENHVDL